MLVIPPFKFKLKIKINVNVFSFENTQTMWALLFSFSIFSPQTFYINSHMPVDERLGENKNLDETV